MKRRDNNRGFTLVELIIAVAILAIAVSPLVANFIQSSKMNLASRKNLNAMTLAQDMMEGMSGYKGDEIDRMIREIKFDPTNAKPLAGTIFPATATCGSVEIYAGTSYAYADANEGTLPDKTKPYGYKFNNVETITGQTHNKYNVELLLDPSGTDQENFNNKKLANISEINQYYDAIFTMPSDEEAKVWTDFSQKSSTGRSATDFKGNVKRTTYINIVNNGTETAPIYNISVNREYTCMNAGAYGLADTYVKPFSADNISNMETDKLPRSVYFYFEGIEAATFSGVAAGNPQECIQISNTTGKDIKVYLIRTQKQSEATTMEDYNQNFGCRVDIVSKNMLGADTENVKIVSNLRYDLSLVSGECNERDKDEAGGDISSGLHADGCTSAYSRERAVYYYNGLQINETMYQKNFHAGYESDEKNTIYKVVINIYDANTGNKVATYDGGVSN